MNILIRMKVLHKVRFIYRVFNNTIVQQEQTMMHNELAKDNFDFEKYKSGKRQRTNVIQNSNQNSEENFF